MISKLVKILIAMIMPFLGGCDLYYEILKVENLSDKTVYLNEVTYEYNGNIYGYPREIKPRGTYHKMANSMPRKEYFTYVSKIQFIFMNSNSDGSCNEEEILLDITLNETQLRALNWTVKYPMSDGDREIIDQYID